jgi:hypothetical protein
MRTAILLEAGMNGDLHAWAEGLALLDGTRLTDEERERLRVLGGPPPLELERALWRLGAPTRPPGHVERLRRLGAEYGRAVDGNEDALRWLEAALGHRPGTLTRCDLLGQDGLPLRLPPFDEGLEAGWLDEGWLEDVSRTDLAAVCRFPEAPEPVWAQLRVAAGQTTSHS